jgi:transposase
LPNRGANISVIAAVSTVSGLLYHKSRLGGTKACTFIEALQELFALLRAQEAGEHAAHQRRILLMDNAPIHKTAAVRRCIEEAGFEVIYYPPWSPMLSPIEEHFAKWKRLVNAQLGTDGNTRSLVESIDDAAKQITEADINGYYRHCKLFIGACFARKPIGADVVPEGELETFEIVWNWSEKNAQAFRAVHPKRKRGRPRDMLYMQRADEESGAEAIGGDDDRDDADIFVDPSEAESLEPDGAGPSQA